MNNQVKICLVIVVLSVSFVYLVNDGSTRSNVNQDYSIQASNMDNKISKMENQMMLLNKSVENLARIVAHTALSGEKAANHQSDPDQDAGLVTVSEEVESVSEVSEITPDMDERERQDVFNKLTHERAVYRENLDQIIAQDGVDNNQTVKTREKMYSTIDEFSRNQVHIEAMNCSTSYCKAVFIHESPNEQEEFMEDIQGRPGFLKAGIAHTEYDEVNGARTFIYLAESGIKFPQFN